MDTFTFQDRTMNDFNEHAFAFSFASFDTSWSPQRCGLPTEECVEKIAWQMRAISRKLLDITQMSKRQGEISDIS